VTSDAHRFAPRSQSKIELLSQRPICPDVGGATLLFFIWTRRSFSVAFRRMDTKLLAEGLASYLCIVVIITVHEFGHAWMASRCGDDTARSLGRVTLNPIAHMDAIGTVVLPLLVVLLSASGSSDLARFIIGWGKPVPVNPLNFRHRVRDDILVAMAGPTMNVLLAIAVMAVGRAAILANSPPIINAALLMAMLSMFLCFFNLLPVPPLDGSHIMKYIVRMKHETFLQISRYGFFIVIVLVQIKPVVHFLQSATMKSLALLAWAFRF
jgi:Zn-dependent protease